MTCGHSVHVSTATANVLTPARFALRATVHAPYILYTHIALFLFHTHTPHCRFYTTYITRLNTCFDSHRLTMLLRCTGCLPTITALWCGKWDKRIRDMHCLHSYFHHSYKFVNSAQITVIPITHCPFIFISSSHSSILHVSTCVFLSYLLVFLSSCLVFLSSCLLVFLSSCLLVFLSSCLQVSWGSDPLLI